MGTAIYGTLNEWLDTLLGLYMQMVHWGAFWISFLELLRMNIIIINFFWGSPTYTKWRNEGF